MKLKDVADRCLESSVYAKKLGVTEDPEFVGYPVIEAFRAGEPIAVVFCRDMDFDDFDHVLFAVGTGLRADRLAYSAETWLSVGPTNPDTGQEWEPGGLEAYNERHGSDDVVSEAMMVSAVNSAGDILVVTQAFRVDTSAGAPTFELLQRTDVSSDDEVVESYLTTVMFDAMNATAEMAQLVITMAEETGMSLFEANVLADWYALQKLAQAGCPSTLTTQSLEYAKALESLTNRKMFDNVQDAFNAARKAND